MKKPVPNPVLNASGHREAAASRQDSPHSKATPIQLNFRFNSAMKPQRVYPLTVQLPQGVVAKGSTSTASLVVKPCIPGALVVPAEQLLDLNPSGESVTFHVTPLAKGRLKDAKVDVSHCGRLVERVQMRMIGKTQRLTWILFLLTLIIPFVILYYTVIAPLDGQVPRMLPAIAAAEKPKAAPPPEGVQMPPGMRPPAPSDDDTSGPRLTKGDHGAVLQYRISNTVRKNAPNIPRISEATAKYVVTNSPSDPNSPGDALEWCAWAIGRAYEYLCSSADSLNPAFYCALVLFCLTIASFFSHRPTRAKISKKGIRLTDPALLGSARAGAHDEPVTVVEAVN